MVLFVPFLTLFNRRTFEARIPARLMVTRLRGLDLTNGGVQPDLAGKPAVVDAEKNEQFIKSRIRMNNLETRSVAMSSIFYTTYDHSKNATNEAINLTTISEYYSAYHSMKSTRVASIAPLVGGILGPDGTRMKFQHVVGSERGRIEMYALSTCMWCKMTKSLLQQLNVAYDYVDVDLLEGGEKDQAKEAIRRWNPAGNYPTIVIDDRECLAGYDEEKIRARLV